MTGTATEDGFHVMPGVLQQLAAPVTPAAAAVPTPASAAPPSLPPVSLWAGASSGQGRGCQQTDAIADVV